MNRSNLTLPQLLACVSLATLLLLPGVHAQTAPQDVALVAGWNAVWLEVEPVYRVGDMATVYNEANPTGTVVTLVEGDSLLGLPKRPEDLFPTATHASIEIIASPKPFAGTAEFFAQDPGTIGTFNQDDWEQWRRTDPPGSNNLVMVTGNRAYLIKVEGPTAPPAFTVEGMVRFFRPKWTPDRYNLVGFGLAGAPTFEDFFGPSGGRHPLTRIDPTESPVPPPTASIFRLNSSTGAWVGVNPGDSMASDEAYWIFCSGPSDYMGPVAVDFDLAGLGALSFGGPGDAVSVDEGVDALELDLEEIVFTNLNETGAAAAPALELITADPGVGTLDLHVVHLVPGSLEYTRGNQVDTTADDGTSGSLGESEEVAPQSTAVLTLGARRNWSGGQAGRTNLYRLRTGDPGTEFWLPVRAIANDLQSYEETIPASPGGSVAGLWVGEVIVDGVTSFVEDGAPVRPSAGSAPIRILLHSDGDGVVTLLSQITIMQTRGADLPDRDGDGFSDSVELGAGSDPDDALSVPTDPTIDPGILPKPVLVVDAAQIPFFEGVKERNGKRVGLRLEAVAYDMPRKIDATSQAALLEDEAYPGLTDAAGIPDFLVSRTIRPPSLEEDYHLSWSMSGSLGAGQTVSTGAPLNLDPFHRSNPFRHAFHQQHPRGPNINRSLSIEFDPGQAIAGRLRGAFHETITGLTKSNLELTGRIELQRVSAVDTLEGAQ